MGIETENRPLTAVEEFILYVTNGVVPSLWAIRKALGSNKPEVLHALDNLQRGKSCGNIT